MYHSKRGVVLQPTPLINLAYVSDVKSSFPLMSKQGGLSNMPIAAIAFHKNLNLLAEVRHDVRPLMCLFIRV
jgi:hypothetical protein